MKILVANKFCPLHPKAGGSEKHLLEIFSRLGEKHEVILISAMFPGAKREEIIKNIKIVRFGSEKSENIIAIHLLFPFLISKFLKIYKPDLFIEDISLAPLFTPVLFPRQKKIIIIHHLNGRWLFKSQNFVYAAVGYLAEKLFLLLYKNEEIIVVSGWMRVILSNHGFKNVAKILNGVDGNLFNIRKNYSKNPTILFLGHLEVRKGADLFLKTFTIVKNAFPNVKYIIAGRRFENFKGKEISGVEFLGYVPEEKKRELLSSAWLFVMPSRIEGYGIVSLEANATGTFVVGNNVPGLQEVIKDNETGALVNCFDADKFGKTIISWLDTEKLKSHEEACRFWAKSHAWEKSAEEFEKLISNLQNKPG